MSKGTQGQSELTHIKCRYLKGMECEGCPIDLDSCGLSYGVINKARGRPDKPVIMTRSRPYKKDDNCYVEQKNFTHVRGLFGYARLDCPDLIPLMNEIYKEYWCPLQNFFVPTQKLLRKTRIGARIKKEYEPAKTPYQRLIESSDLTDGQKSELQNRKFKYNLFILRKDLQLKLKEFEEKLRQWRTGLIAA